MKVEVTTPDEYQGSVIGDLSSRRGMIQGSETDPNGEVIVNAEVPLSEMFGYSSDLRSMSKQVKRLTRWNSADMLTVLQHSRICHERACFRKLASDLILRIKFSI